MLKEYLEERIYLKHQNRFLRFFIFLLIVALIVQSLVMFFAIKYERTILVPVTLSREVGVSDYRPDEAYIEEMVKYIAYLGLNYTPETVEWQFAGLLKLFTPDRYSAYRNIFFNLAQDVKTAEVSSFFQVTYVKVNYATRKILMSGKLQQWTRDKKFIADDQRYYIIEYVFDHGKFMLREFYECKQNCQV